MWTKSRSSRLVLLLGALVFTRPAAAQTEAPPEPTGDPLDALRGRFRDGMEKYHARAFGDAIVIWESIYRELGAEKGYRVAFDLGRAYDEIGELIKAAEHYQSYLERVAQRRQAGESLEVNVETQETIAKDRLERIIHIYGGIRVNPAKRPVFARVDNDSPRVAGFTSYVEPGPHTVTFGAGAGQEIRTIVVKRGELFEVTPKDEPEPPVVRYETHIEHPFSPWVVWIGAGVAAASIIVPIITHESAQSIKSDYDQATTLDAKNRLSSDYASARSNAYATIAIPAGLAVAVSGLAVWYLAGTKEVRTPLPTVTVDQTGATAGIRGTF